MSPRATDYLRFTWQLLAGLRSSDERGLAAERERDVAPYLLAGQPLRVLDLANGRLRPQYILLKNSGHQVYGIDLVNQRQSDWTELAYRAARWLYARRAGVPSKAVAQKTLVCGDVSYLPFVDNCFDLVTSIAAFEHFLDVPAVLAEMRRVLRPGGLAWIRIHPFTCLSGAHNLSLLEIPLRRLPPGVDPWDHLRKRRLPLNVLLNEWRRDQYLEAFAGHFEIVGHRCAHREGEEWLTPEIEQELAAYTRDELTCGAYVILARKVE